MTRAAIYARVSTKKEEQATSVPNQVASCTRYCEQRGWEITATESDKLTGRNMQRPGWQRILALVEAGAVDAVVITHRDRVSRNRRDFEDVRLSHFEPRGVRLVPLMGVEVDPAILQTRWMEEDEFTQAQRFSELLSWKTRMGRLRRLEQGYWPNTPPYGTMAGDVKGVPVKHPEEWPVLIEMFELAARGLSYGAVRRALHGAGHRARGGGEWSYSSIYDIIPKPFYRGEGWQDGHAYPLKHECRIDAALWQAAQGECRPQRAGRHRNGAYIYLVPRVVCSHYAITHPLGRAGEPLPLRARHTLGRGGRPYYYYYRADRLRGSGGVTAESADGVPLSGRGSLRAAISAPELDRHVVQWFMRDCRDHGLLEVNLREGTAEQLERVTRSRAALRGQLTRVHREQTQLEGDIARAAADAEWAEVLRALAARSRAAREREDELTVRIAALDLAERELGRQRERLAETVATVNAVEVLWRAGDYPALLEVLRLLVNRVDLRLDTPRIYLQPVMTINRATPPLGEMSEPLAVPREMLAA